MGQRADDKKDHASYGLGLDDGLADVLLYHVLDYNPIVKKNQVLWKGIVLM